MVVGFLMFLVVVGAEPSAPSQPRAETPDGGLPSAAKGSSVRNMPEMSGEAMSPSTTTYHQVFEMGGRKIEGKLERKVTRAELNGRSVWKIVDSLTTSLGTANDELWLDFKTLLPIKRLAKQGPATVTLTVTSQAITGEQRIGENVMPINAKTDGPVLLDGASLEVALSSLPLEPDYKANLRTFNTMTGQFQTWTAEVIGKELLRVQEKEFDTYKVSVSHADGSGAIVWINALHRVVKSEAKLVTPGGTGRITKVIDVGS